jgi:hypothetical protein
MAENGDVTNAYLESHPNCSSKQRAKYAGRTLLKRGDVRALIAVEKAKAVAGQGDSNPRKMALLEELNLVGYAGVNLKKIHPKEKLTALRTIAEIEGWMKPKDQGKGVRATFNFIVGGARRGAVGRTVTVDVDADQAAGGVGVGLDPDSPPNNVGVAKQPDNKLVGVGLPSDSESESESDVRLSDRRRSRDGQPRADDGQVTDSRAQLQSQVADSTVIESETVKKGPNASILEGGRSTPTGRSESPVSAKPVDNSPRRLFDASNT